MMLLSVVMLRSDGSGQVGILIGSQIPEKLPAVTDLTDKFQIKIGDHNFVFVFTALDQQLAARIYEETKGNPYFTVELMRSLVESGSLVRRDGSWEIELDKRLPMGGGLGGGSSDAASVLLVLNHLWGLGLDLDDLAGLGLRLGADVPVFVRGEAAWGEGVGERLTPVQLPEPWYLVLMPACQVATEAVFSAPELTRDSTPITIRDFLQGSQANDCLPVVRRNYPEVAAALDWLDRFAPARLTGTGACVFAAFATADQARAPLASLPARWRGWVAQGRNVSPLHAALRSAAV